MRPCLVLLWTLALITTNTSSGSVMQGRMDCPEGYTKWPADLTCHRTFSQGPCAPGQVLTSPPQGPACVELDMVARVEGGGEDAGHQGGWGLGGAWGIGGLGGSTQQVEQEHQEETEGGHHSQTADWSLPTDTEHTLTPQERACLEREQVWWPDTGLCYSLLSRGPCGQGEWLVLRREGDSVVCSPRLCPCDPATPDMCEVQVENTEDRRWGQCRVATAAAQEGLCQVGEQLMVNPYGLGVCSCITSPPHAVWPEDGRCYPLHSQGPCREGFIFSISSSRMVPECLPGICYQGHIHDSATCETLGQIGTGSCYNLGHNRGSCNKLGSRGPCDEHEVLGLDHDTLDPSCVPNISKIKRVYDITPSTGGLVSDGPLSRDLKIGNCRLDSNGRCRKSFFVRRGRSMEGGISRGRGERFYIRKKSAREYLDWLRTFRRARRRSG